MAGLERWHFHNNTYDGPIGIDIQKIFISSTASAEIPTDAKMVVDYTLENPAVNVIDPPFVEPAEIWTVKDGYITTGERNDTEYHHLSNVSSPIGVDTVYWGFVIRNASATAKAESIRMQGDGATLTDKSPIPLAVWFGLDSASDYEPEDPSDDPDPVIVVENWNTVYFNLSGDFADPEVINFHFDGESSIEIQKIFVNSTASETGAVTLFDFAATPAYTDSDFYYVNGMNDFVTEGKYACSDDDSAYRWGGNFGTSKLAGQQYIGFVIKSSGLGASRFEVGKGNPYVKQGEVHFSTLLLPDLTKWSIAYQEITDSSVSEINFHAETGNIEIQKIFINTKKSMDDAVTLFDFTVTPSFTTSDTGLPLYWETISSRVADGKYVYTGSGTYTHGGGFGTANINSITATYIGFVFKTNTADVSGLGNFRVQVGPDTNIINVSAMQLSSLSE